MSVRRLLVAMLTAVCAAALASCGGGGSSQPAMTWRASELPVPTGRQAVAQAAVWCGSQWWVTGATADSRGDTRPAAWRSGDGLSWRSVVLQPGRDYYAERAILTSVGCSNDRLAALGAKPGGAHGNPRVETWRQLADGSLAAVPAPFEQYGGQDAVAVTRLSGGTAGYLVSGTRVSGAAVWSSPTGARFTLHEKAPGLATTPADSTLALDAAWWQGAWTVVGDSTLDSGRLVATAWSGAGDGPWMRTPLPGGKQVTTGEQVTLTDAGPVVAGIQDDTFAIWSEHDGRWSQDSTFGQAVVGATSPDFVSGLAWTGSVLVAAYSDGVSFRLALGPTTSLSGVPLPTPVTNRGDHSATVATHGHDLLLLTDDGHHSQVWLTHVER